jgi:hypothetical protein
MQERKIEETPNYNPDENDYLPTDSSASNTKDNL